MKLILAGGGGAAVSAPLDRHFAGWLGANASLLYLPFALPDDHRLVPGCEAWIASVFGPHGIRRIVTLHGDAALAPDRSVRLDQVDGVYIGGGNTFRLRRILRQSGLDTEIAAFAQAGGSVYGGSAGAVIMGTSIAHAARFDRQDTEPEADTSGLDLLLPALGHVCLVVPHFTAGWERAAHEIAQAWAMPVVGIPEPAGLVIDGDQVMEMGAEPLAWILPG